jgi:hypothetical protein
MGEFVGMLGEYFRPDLFRRPISSHGLAFDVSDI